MAEEGKDTDTDKGTDTPGGGDQGVCTSRAYPLLSEEPLDAAPMASYVRKRSVSASLPHVARASRRMSEHLAVSAAAEKQPWLLAQASRGGNGDVGGSGGAGGGVDGCGHDYEYGYGYDHDNADEAGAVNAAGAVTEPTVSSPVLRGVQEGSEEEDDEDEDEERHAHSLSDAKGVGGRGCNGDDDGEVQWF